jgi:hypothetical protein
VAVEGREAHHDALDGVADPGVLADVGGDEGREAGETGVRGSEGEKVKKSDESKKKVDK